MVKSEGPSGRIRVAGTPGKPQVGGDRPEKSDTMHFSTTEKTLYLKLVYYGPGLSGKTTNLEAIHKLTDPEGRYTLVSLKTEQDRTLFFDLLPFDLGTLYGLSVRIKLYTVPGQIQYDTTRKQVLAGADGVAFIADSDPRRREENVRMLKYLANNLRDNKLDPQQMPLVFQWNKRDLREAMPVEEMNRALNPRKLPAVEATAVRGLGVMETFRELAIVTLENLAANAPSPTDRQRRQTIRPLLTERFEKWCRRGETPLSGGEAVARVGTVHDQESALAEHTRDGRHKEVLGLNELLAEAVQANLQIAEQAASRVAQPSPSDATRRERKTLSRMVAMAGRLSEPPALLRLALNSALAGTDMSIGSVLAPSRDGSMPREICCAGRESDPLNAVTAEGIGSAATGLLQRGETYLSHDLHSDLLFGRFAPSVDGLRGLLAVPIHLDGRVAAMILIYSAQDGRDLNEQDMEFVSIVSGIAGLTFRGLPAVLDRTQGVS